MNIGSQIEHNGSAQTESRFRLIVVAALRAKQLLHGAKPRVDADIQRRKHTSIAMEEVRLGLVHFERFEGTRPRASRRTSVAENPPKQTAVAATSRNQEIVFKGEVNPGLKGML